MLATLAACHWAAAKSFPRRVASSLSDHSISHSAVRALIGCTNASACFKLCSASSNAPTIICAVPRRYKMRLAVLNRGPLLARVNRLAVKSRTDAHSPRCKASRARASSSSVVLKKRRSPWLSELIDSFKIRSASASSPASSATSADNALIESRRLSRMNCSNCSSTSLVAWSARRAWVASPSMR